MGNKKKTPSEKNRKKHGVIIKNSQGENHR